MVLTANEVASLKIAHPEEQAGKLLARRGTGCTKGRFTGYYGRSGIFEVLGVNARLRKLNLRGGRRPRRSAARPVRTGCARCRARRRQVAAGNTTLEEALRVTADAKR